MLTFWKIVMRGKMRNCPLIFGYRYHCTLEIISFCHSMQVCAHTCVHMCEVLEKNLETVIPKP